MPVRALHQKLAMNNTASVALSGMNAAQVQMSAVAHNVANTNTPGLRRQQVHFVPQAQGGVAATAEQADVAGSAIESDMVALLQAKQSYLANLSVFKTSHRMTGLLLHEKA